MPRDRDQKRSPYGSNKPARPGSRPSSRSATPFGKPAFSKPYDASYTLPRPEGLLPGATLARRATEKLLEGHVWVYATDLLGIEPQDAPAGLMPVRDQAGRLLGTALYSPTSQIALRMVSPLQLDEPAWLALMQKRLVEAIARRQSMLDAENDSVRLVFSEADALPGLIIDKYAGVAVMQLLARGIDTPAVREALVATLKQELASTDLTTILERPDPRIRELEQLSAPSMEPLYAVDLASPITAAVFKLNNLSFQFDANAGQKTGAFLDQRENYAAAARHGHGEALDVCTYQGGFALHLATTCRRVTGVDVSQAALEVAERNLELNREALGSIEVDWVKADAFELMRDYADSGAEYDTIVLDPPAFAKSKRAAENAMRGYKELNLRAFKMLRPGGTLVTCSCSHHVPLEEFQAVVAAAAGDAGRRVRLIERRGASADHPVILTIPETEYLKCLVLEVE